MSLDDYWIYVFDVVMGKLKWKYGIVDEGGLKCVFNFDEMVVYCGIDDKLLCVFNVVDGSFIWKFFIGGVVMLLIWVGVDGSFYFGCLDGYFYVVNFDGFLKWKKNLDVEVWLFFVFFKGGKVVFVGLMVEDLVNVFLFDS